MDLLNITSQFLSFSTGMAESFGYLGIFVISLLGSATIFLPVPALIVVFAFGGILNPWIVGIVAGAGAAIGELIGYALGYGGKGILEKKYGKDLEKTKRWMEKHGAFLIIILFALTPLPDDIIGILCGVINYDLKKFFAASLIGKIIMHVLVALAGYMSVQWVLAFFTL
ncbi:MAG: VTT domain-containing protein [Candidatus Aenigmarchaeota archaeon]|nr:VTT domain-containing protein [Candidatus Aenigmarchaeota archaeon]